MSIITFKVENRFYLLKSKRKHNSSVLPFGSHTNTLTDIQGFYNLATNKISTSKKLYAIFVFKFLFVCLFTSIQYPKLTQVCPLSQRKILLGGRNLAMLFSSNSGLKKGNEGGRKIYPKSICSHLPKSYPCFNTQLEPLIQKDLPGHTLTDPFF